MRIKSVASQNGFPENLIDNLIRKHKFNLSLRNSTTLQISKEKVKWAKLLYYPLASNKIAKVFQRFNLRVAHFSNNKSKSLLGSSKDKTPTFEKSGIYKISCEECDHVYIGQTISNILTRYKEHDYNYRFVHSEKSSVAKHRHDTGHKITSQNLSLLHEVNNSRQLDALETFYVFKENCPLMNADKGPIQHSCLFQLI